MKHRILVTAFALLAAAACERDIQVGVVPDAGEADAGAASDAGPCTAETDSELCAKLGRACGAASTTDRCGVQREVASCGGCSDGFVCEQATGQCRCADETDAQLCQRLGRVCGKISAADLCGQSRAVDCGACEAGFVCNASGNCDACTSESKEEFCSRTLGAGACGSYTDSDNCGLGRTEDCGGCTGTDFCDDTHHCHACVPDSDADFCAANGHECGSLTATDNCGVSRTVAECGPCGNQAELCINDQCVLCTPENDAIFCSRLGTTCGTVIGNDNCGIRRTVASCGTCTEPDTCLGTRVCGTPGVPRNDTCANPKALAFDATGTAYAYGDTTLATMSGDPTCDDFSGLDVVYSFTTTSTKDVRVVVTPDANVNTYRPSVYLRSVCDGYTSEVLCGAAPADGTAADVTAYRLPPGTWYVWVDGINGASSGQFVLQVTASDPPRPPANDTCANAGALVIDPVTHKATVSGSTAEANNDDSARCDSQHAPFNGPDVVYSFTLTGSASVVATVAADASNIGFRTAVSIRSDCTSASERTCATATNGTAAVALKDLAAGTYYVFVDGIAGSAGRFNLTLQVFPGPLNDDCAQASGLIFDANGVATAYGNTLMATPSGDGTCRGSTGNDLVYSFTTTSQKNVEIEVTPDNGSALRPQVYLQSTCGQSSSERTCAFTTTLQIPAKATKSRLPAGTWFVWVDGTSMDFPGAFTLKVTAVDPQPAPAWDTCAGAQPLVFDPVTRVAQVSGNTINGYDDYRGSCQAATDHGGDFVYRIDLSAPASMVASVSRSAGETGATPALYIRSDCTSSLVTDEKACATYAEWPSNAEVKLGYLAAGSYYVIVDGAMDGAFDLSVALGAPVTNDNCTAPNSAEQLTFDAQGVATVTNSTEFGTNDGAGSCDTLSNNDLVYSFTLAAEKDVLVVISTPAGSDLRAMAYLRSACDVPGSEVACAVQSFYQQPLKLAARRVQPGTWYLWVDGWGAPSLYSGAFTMTVTLTDPPQGPANDTCLGAEALAFDPTTNKATVTADTSSARNQYAGTCASATSMHTGGDVVYSFTTTATRKVTARVTAAASELLYRPAVYIRSTCDSALPADELACGNEAGGFATVTVASLPAGTYYVIVDGVGGSSGGYTLEVTQESSVANDNCAGQPEELVFDPTGTATATGDTSFGINDGDGSCQSGSGGDLVYKLTVSTDKQLNVVVTPTSGSTLKPVVYLRSVCDDTTTQASCSSTWWANSPINLFVPKLGPGTYYLWVDSSSGADAGGFTLEANLADVVLGNENCSRPEELVFDASGVATASGTTVGATDDDRGTCNQASSNDLVYRFTLSAEKDITAVVAPSPGSKLQPSVYLRSSCSRATSELGCLRMVRASPATLRAGHVQPGTYYLWVDGLSAVNSGAFWLTVTATDPANPLPSNDTCNNPEPLTFDATTGRASVTATTANSAQQYAGTCAASGQPQSGPDNVYSFTLTSDAAVSAKVTRDGNSSSYNPAVYIRSNCGSGAAADELACGTSLSGVATANASFLSAGTYYVIVDGMSGSSGGYTLEVSTSAPIGNDTCAHPAALTFDPTTGVATAAGDITGATNSGDGTCGGFGSGNDLVYSFTTTATKDIAVSVTPDAGSGIRPYVYVRSSCSDVMKEVACTKVTAAGATASLAIPHLAAGTYFVWVDSSETTYAGAFTLSVTATGSQSTVPNDFCSGAQSLAVSQTTGTVSVTGTTVGAADEEISTCATAASMLNGGDVFYAVTLASDSMLGAKVTRDAASTTFQPALSLRSGCDLSSELDCQQQSNGVATVSAALLHAGTYYLVVDGAQGTRGGFTLDVTVGPPLQGDTCADAVPVTLDPATGVGTVTGDTTYASDTSRGVCNQSTWPDLVYSFTIATPKKVDVTVTPTAAGLYPALYLRTDCASPATEVGCRYNYGNAPVTASFPRLDPGTYYAWVDGLNAGGPFQLEIVASDPLSAAPANDECSGATPLVFNPVTNKASVVGETTNANSTTTGTCDTTLGPDVVYSFTITQAQKVTAQVVRDSSTGSYLPVVYLRSACSSALPSAELTCAKDKSGTTVAVVNDLPAGTYYLWVDGAKYTTGKYVLDVTLSAPVPTAPANETCATVTPLTFSGGSATVAGSTVGAVNEATGTCAFASGLDVVYSFTTTQDQKITATVTPTPYSVGYQPAVYIRSNCASLLPSDELACGKTTAGGNPATVVVPAAPAGTYYVWVDSANANTSGDFSLDVRLDALPAPQQGDTCASAIPVVQGQSVSGDTAVYLANYSNLNASCASISAPAPEVVYSFTPTSSGMYTASVVPSTWDAVLWMSSATCGGPSSCTAAADQGADGGAETLAFVGLAGTTYYFYVDGYLANSGGTYTFVVR